jgi:hypothetical protein
VVVRTLLLVTSLVTGSKEKVAALCQTMPDMKLAYTSGTKRDPFPER